MTDPLPESYRLVRFQCNEEDLPDHFFVVTGRNPQGQTLSDKANARADEDLRQAISTMDYPAVRVTGGNFDFSHAEPGWGIECALEDARALALSFGQLAFYEVRGDLLLLHATTPSATMPEEIGSWSDRLDDGEPVCPFCLTRAMTYPCDHLLTTFDSWRGSWTLEEGFYEGLYEDLVKGGLATAEDAEEPSEDEEQRRSRVIRETLHAAVDHVTTAGLDQGPGFSSNLEYLWAKDPDTAYRRICELLAAGGSGSLERP